MVNKISNTISLGVIFGGKSAEHEISIISAVQATTAIDTTKYKIVPIYINPKGVWYTGSKLLDRNFFKKFDKKEVVEVCLLPEPGHYGIYQKPSIKKSNLIQIDCFLTVFHGQNGEDGNLQGLLEMSEIPFTSSGVLALSVAMNKYICKKTLSSIGIPSLPAIVINKTQFINNESSKLIKSWKKKYPLFIKPCHLGSSIGVSRVQNEAELLPALSKVFRYDEEAIIEPCVSSLMEINISVARIRGEITASVVEVPVSDSGVLTYEEKYMRGGSKKGQRTEGMASLTRVINPDDLDQNYKDNVKKYAVDSYRFLNCKGIVRFDFIVDLTSGELYFNELNPIPGSLSFYLWEKSSPVMLMTDLIDEMVMDAFNQSASKKGLQSDLGFKAL